MRLKSLLPIMTIAAMAALPVTAAAQSVPRVTFTPMAASTAPAPASITQTATGSYWELIGGAEFASDGLFYGFFGPQWTKPMNDDVAVFARAYANWLQYEFDEAGGTTSVSGPGISTQVGLKFGGRHSFKVGAGPSFKWRNGTFTDADGNESDIDDLDDDGEIDDDMEIGFSVGADAYINATDRDVIHGIVNYETVDEYLWSRLAYKRQITNLDWSGTWAHSIGAEGILQGNDDIRTLMLGGLVEFTHARTRTSLMLRGGFKRSSFDTADDKTGPYFGVNFYRRLGR